MPRPTPDQHEQQQPRRAGEPGHPNQETPMHTLNITPELVAAERAEHAAHEAARHAATPPTLPGPAAPVVSRALSARAGVGHLPAGRLAAAMAQVAADPAGADALAAKADAAALEEVRQAARTARWGAYARSVPREYVGAGYGDLTAGQDVDGRVSRWWASTSKTLVLSGEPGRGKTRAGYAVCNTVAAADRDGHGRPVVVRALRVTDAKDDARPADVHAQRDEVASADRARRLEVARTCDLLLLDDPTAAFTSDWWREQMWALLDERCSEHRRTILTVNAPAKDQVGKTLNDQLGAAIVSRVRDGAVSLWVEGPDWRQHAVWDPFA